MMIRQRDGIHFEFEETVVADARSAVGDVNVVSHAHADHLFRGAGDATVVCSPETAALIEHRTGSAVSYTDSYPNIELLPAGHIVGSRAMLVEIGDGRRVLYTGDVSVRDRLSLTGFDPVSADELVVETTYGDPTYRFPDQESLEADIEAFLETHDETPLLLFGYSLGRAQELQRLARRATDRRIVVHDSVANVNEVVEQVTDLSFNGTPYADVEEIQDGDIFVVPSHLSRHDWIDELCQQTGALKVGFSGWAVTESYKYRGGYDETFVLSDHCDFDELVSLVKAVDPERVYTQHGFAEEFARHLTREHGYRARPLQRDQHTLDEYTA